MTEALRLTFIAALALLTPLAVQGQQGGSVTYNVGGYLLECPNPGYEGVHPTVPSCTHNLMIQEIDQRINRLVQELQRQVSGRVTGISANDKERIDQQYAWLLGLITTADTMQDFHYLTTFELMPYEMHQPVTENNTVNLAVKYLIGADANMRISQSTRLNDGLTEHDLEDLVDAVNRSKAHIDREYTNFNPMDMPQSSPSAPVATPTSQ